MPFGLWDYLGLIGIHTDMLHLVQKVQNVVKELIGNYVHSILFVPFFETAFSTQIITLRAFFKLEKFLSEF